MTTKRRTTTTMSGTGTYKVISLGAEVSRTSYPVSTLHQEELAYSQSNPWPKYKGTGLDVGGPFIHRSVDVDKGSFIPFIKVLSTPGIPENGGSGQIYEGPILAFSTQWTNTGGYLSTTSTAVLNAAGTTAISRSSPTNPLAGLGQFLGELRDLPKVPDIKDWKRKADSFRKLARKGSKEYLNAVFGWLPFVNDIYDVAKNAVNHAAIIKQIDRDSGRSVRRRYTFPSDTQSTVTNNGAAFGSPVLAGGQYSAAGSATTTTTTSTERWFKGAFTYYVPKASSPKFIDRAKRAEYLAKRLYGARINPQTLWQLAPWSWALGWVTNVNDIVNNWTNFTEDGLVLRYGYIMEKKTVKTTYSITGLTFKGYKPVSISQSCTRVNKSRAKATPYGFGLNTSSFSGKQWSVIAALGISKAPQSLNF